MTRKSKEGEDIIKITRNDFVVADRSIWNLKIVFSIKKDNTKTNKNLMTLIPRYHRYALYIR